MKKISVLFAAALLVVGIVGLPLTASACSSMGPGKHMGLVVMIDAEKGHLSIIDAESRQPILFVVDAELLKKVQKKDEIVVTFHEEKDQLMAKDIKIHRS